MRDWCERVTNCGIAETDHPSEDLKLDPALRQTGEQCPGLADTQLGVQGDELQVLVRDLSLTLGLLLVPHLDQELYLLS